jgi:predicted enzyme related to lactoylglutathione lyase
MPAEAVLSAITEAVFGYLLEETTLGEKIKGWLRLDPQRLAFQIALARAYTDFAKKYPDWANSLFDEHFLAHRAAPTLALCLQRDDTARPEDLAEVWADQLGHEKEVREKRVTDLGPVADDLLNFLEAELRKRPEFQPLFDSRALDTIGEATERTAEAVEALQAELNQVLQAAQRVTAKGKRSAAVGGDMTGGAIFTGDMFFTAIAEASVPISRHIRLREFQTLVSERTKRFVGRDYIFEAIDDMVEDPDFPSGYIVIQGEPGIGKTALIAQMIKQAGYVHHFNISAQNIRDARDFLANVCAQLIVRYELAYLTLPLDAEKDSGFLSQLLAEVAEKEEDRPTVILVDAVDEAEDIGFTPGANILYLPQALPDGIFFIVTTREVADFRLFVDHRKDIYMRDDDPHNLKDVRRYIQNYVEEHRTKMAPRIEGWGVEEDEFVQVITEKSEGNFMYLVFVMRDIRDGKLTAENVDNIHNLPQGLEDYYKRHWRAMRAEDKEQFDKYQEPVVCILATVREPVTIAQVQEWTKLRPTRIKRVIDEWREFFNVDEPKEGEALYRIYHASFQDFLKKEVGLVQYHDKIAMTALRKIPGFLKDEIEE